MSRATSENNSAIPLKRYLIYLFVTLQFIFAWILIGLTVKMYERGFLNQSLTWLDTGFSVGRNDGSTRGAGGDILRRRFMAVH